MGDRLFRLVKWTVQYASERSPYYGQTIGKAPIDDWRAFRHLPIVDRKTLAEQGKAMRVPGVSVSHIGTTSGTTSGSRNGNSAPLLVYRSEGERQAAQDLLGYRVERLPADSGLVLSLLDAAHGHDQSIGAPGILGVPCAEPHHLDVIASVLGDSFETEQGRRRITSVAGSHFVLKLLTLGLAGRGIGLAGFDVRLVASKGGLLTQRWRRLLARAWRASVADVYGVSEVPGFHCVTCASCGGFRPAKTAFVEYLDRHTYEEAPSGVARLVVTALYPLAEVVPLIRYDTGDIVYRNPDRAEPCAPCFTLLGRASDLVDLPGAQAVVSRLRIADVLDDFAPIQRAEEQPLADQLGVRADLGLPLFSVVKAGRSGRLDELRVVAVVRRGDAFRRLARTSSLTEQLKTAVFPPQARGRVIFRLEEEAT